MALFAILAILVDFLIQLIRTRDDEQISIPNSIVANTKIINESAPELARKLYAFCIFTFLWLVLMVHMCQVADDHEPGQVYVSLNCCTEHDLL